MREPLLLALVAVASAIVGALGLNALVAFVFARTKYPDS